MDMMRIHNKKYLRSILEQNGLKICLILVIIFSIASCEKVLDRMPETGLISTEFWKSELDVKASVIGCYDKMQDCIDYYLVWGEIRSDLLLVEESDDRQMLNVQNVTVDNEYTRWQSFYEVLNRANTVLDNISLAKENDKNFTEEQYNQYIAECKFIRALTYFYLTRTFRDVPLILQSYSTDDQDYFVPKDTMSLILSQIIRDLDDAAEYIPESYETETETHGRATKAAVYALKADACLWKGIEDPSYYNEAIEAADNIINNPYYELMESEDWLKNFSNGLTKENIFELVFDKRELETNDLYDWFKMTDPAFKIRINPKTSKMDIWTKNLISEDKIRGKFASYYGTGTGTDYYVWKYVGKGPNLLTRRLESENDNNWIFYRLADIYLMKAEALNQTGQINEAVEMVNIIRDRAQIGLLDPGISKTSLDMEILAERKRELAFEGKRWFDLVRFALRDYPEIIKTELKEVYDSNNEEEAEAYLKVVNPGSWFLPINREEIKVNSKLEQSDYYKYQQ
jgi:hypothetical protein